MPCEMTLPQKNKEQAQVIKTLKPLITQFLQISRTCQSVDLKISTNHSALCFADTSDY